MRPFLPFAALSLVTLTAIGCSANAEESPAADVSDLSEYSYSSWKVGQTMHVGETIDDSLSEPGGYSGTTVRIVHPIYVGAAADHPVRLTIDLEGEDTDVQAVLLAPLQNGQRAVVASDGKNAPKKSIELAPELTTSGVYLLAVSTHKYLTGGNVRVRSSASSASDAIVSPSSGALTGRSIAVKLNPALADQDVELWTAPPGFGSGQRHKLATVRSTNHEASFTLGESVQEGDDVFVVLPAKAPGTDIPLDSGTGLRLWTKSAEGVRIDRLGISDFGNMLSFTGVTGFWEGGASIALVSADRVGEDGKPLRIGSAYVHRDRPGQVGMGLASFEAHLGCELGDPRTPHENEVLAVGTVSERPSFFAMTCFRFCNDLSGMSSCSIEELPCPASVQQIDL